MLIDESEMAVDSSFSFLNLRKQHTILNWNFYLRLKHKTTLTEQNRSTNTSYDRPGSDCKRLNRDRPDSGRTLHTLAIAQFRSPNYTATQANHRYTHSAKMPTKLIPKNHPLLEY